MGQTPYGRSKAGIDSNDACTKNAWVWRGFSAEHLFIVCNAGII